MDRDTFGQNFFYFSSERALQTVQGCTLKYRLLVKRYSLQNSIAMAKARARQRLVDSGVSESELLEHERMDFISDAEVMDANHNFLRASWNAENPDKSQIKINYLFDCPVEVENYKRALDKMNSLLYKDRTPEVIDAEYELLRAMYEAGI